MIWLKPSLNWLLIFIPISVVLEHIGNFSPPIVFFSAAIAIIPIAKIIVDATEQLAIRTGDAIGGLLNATFGNAPELIISVVALKAGYFDIVRASLIGAILANLMLSLGLSFILGGIRYRNQSHNPAAAGVYSSMMLISVISLAIPSGFALFFSPEIYAKQENELNIGLAVVLLIAYALYLVFMLKTHPDFFVSAEEIQEASHEMKKWGLPRAIASLLIASVLAAWMSEILVGAAEGTGKALGMSHVFIGIIFVAIVGGAAETGSAIAMARKNKMDLTVGIALGSSIQIALFVAPVLVLLSYFIAPHPLLLSFSMPEIGSMFLAVVIGAMISGDGRSNWYEGVQLITVYIMIALMFYLIPETRP
jgi:Ca2+:H+ antiporter